MKTVYEASVGHILLSHPHAEIKETDGKRIIRIPVYNIETDENYWEEREIVADPEATNVGIFPVFDVRKGAIAKPNGDVKKSPLGHLYRIIGYSPPPKSDSD